MKLAISTSFNYKMGLENNLKAIAEAGFEYISLGGRTSYSNYHKPGGRVKIQKLLDQTGLKIDSIHAPFDPTCDLTQLQELLVQGAVIEMKKIITSAVELNVSTVIFHLNSFNPSKIPARLKIIQKTLPDIVAFAEQNNIVLAMENLGSSSEILFNYALDLVDSPNLRVCYDNGHEMIFSDEFKVLGKYGERLSAIHLHDNDGAKDLHLIPFEGKLNLPALASQLNKLEKIPLLTLECEMINSNYSSPEKFLQTSRSNLLRFVEMLKHDHSN